MLDKVETAVRWLLDEHGPLRADEALFDAPGLGALGEAVVDATTFTLDDPALMRLFRQLPDYLQALARRYGLHDQYVGDQIFGWLEANAHTLPELLNHVQSVPQGMTVTVN